MDKFIKEIGTRASKSNLCVFGLVNEIAERESLSPAEGATLTLAVL